MATNSERPGRYLTLRLWEDERKILQKLGKIRDDTPDRHAAFLALEKIVENLEIEDVRNRKRRALRVKIPDALQAAIDKKIAKTGQTFTHILIEAANEYARQFTK